LTRASIQNFLATLRLPSGILSLPVLEAPRLFLSNTSFWIALTMLKPKALTQNTNQGGGNKYLDETIIRQTLAHTEL
jgi:hypothetical protein